jgi:hypothetical protein
MRNFITSFRTIQRKIEMLGIWSRTSSQKRKTLEIFSETLSKRKHFRKIVPQHDVFYAKSLCYCYFTVPSNLIFYRSLFLSVPNLGMGLSETHGIPRKEHFFPRNNKSVPILFCGIFSERNFIGNHICAAPSIILLKSILQSVLAYSKIRE